MNEKKQFSPNVGLKGKLNKQKGESVAEELRYGQKHQTDDNIKNSNH
jgi:hypothetical protein